MIEMIQFGDEEGRLMFKGLLNDNLISTNKEEQKLLKFFREMNPTNQKKFLQDTEWAFTNTRKSALYRKTKKISRKEEKAKKIFDKWNLDFAVIGKTTNSKKIELFFDNEQ